ncbi:MAG: RNA pseudouridine synthase [Alphaproteobacteria bacterium]|nr:RNA pseudouridine synthase [Alphaproteobacteria bacterium]
MEPRLLATEADWLWLFKPPGLPVFPPHQDPGGACLLSWLLARHPEQGEGFEPRFAGGLAHRLDVSTSGVVLAARSPAALAQARALFSEKRLVKTYRFLTERVVPWREHHVTTPLAHHARRKGRMVVQRGQSTPHRGRWYEADTRFTQLEGPLWQAEIVTGVMHQIRAHAGSVGLAILGDRLYGGAPLPPGAPEGLRFTLHHVGLRGGGLESPRCPPPEAWEPLAAQLPPR